MNGNIDILKVILDKQVELAKSITAFQSSGFNFNKLFEADFQRIETFASSTEEMSTTAESIAKNVTQASEISSENLNNFSNVEKVFNDLSENMVSLEKTIQELNDNIISFINQTKQIHDLTDSIRSIAKRTNLVALNASIEAARAGIHGKSFSVVADEVKKLSDQTALAAEDIEKVTIQISNSSNVVEHNVKKGNEVLNSNSKMIQNGKDIISAASNSTNLLNDNIREIASSAEEQSSVTADLVRIINDLKSSFADQKNELSSLLQFVDKMMSDMTSIFSEFTAINDEKILLGITKSDHIIWVNKVNDAILGKSSIDSKELADHFSCRLGKWYYGPGMEKYSELKSFKNLESIHLEVHKVGKAIVDLVNQGRMDEAQNEVDNLLTLREEVLNILGDLQNSI